MNFSFLLILCAIIFYVEVLEAAKRTVNVRNSQELKNALKEASPGDTIRMADGVYSGKFKITRSGTADNIITLSGNRGAILDSGNVASGYVMHLDGASYWQLDGFTLQNAQKGVVLDRSTHCILNNLMVTKLGMEAIHFRLFSTDNVIQNSIITDTGITKPGFGEGVYIGSSRDKWVKTTDGKPDACDRNKVLNNKIGPYVRGEGVDVKEGTRNGLIANNNFDGLGMSGEHFDDSWIDIKGNDYIIRNNMGHRTLKNGMEVHTHAGGGEGNVFDGNVMDVGESGYGIYIASKKGGKPNVVYDNNKVSKGTKGLTNIKVTQKNRRRRGKKSTKA